MRVSAKLTWAIFLALPGSSQALAQQSAERPPSSLLTLLVTLLPIILIFGVYLWFLRRSGIGKNREHMERSRAHMDRAEQQNDQIIAALDRIEKALSQRQ